VAESVLFVRGGGACGRVRDGLCGEQSCAGRDDGTGGELCVVERAGSSEWHRCFRVSRYELVADERDASGLERRAVECGDARGGVRRDPAGDVCRAPVGIEGVRGGTGKETEEEFVSAAGRETETCSTGWGKADGIMGGLVKLTETSRPSLVFPSLVFPSLVFRRRPRT